LKKTIFLLVFSFLYFITLPSCESTSDQHAGPPSKKQQTALPPSTGSRCEILVVCTEHLWNSRALIPLKNELLRPQPGLPQPEPYFSILRVDPVNFKNVIQRNKAVIIIEESDTTTFQWKSNAFSKPQQLALFTYSDLRQLYVLTARHRSEIFSRFREQDLNFTRRTLLTSGAKWKKATEEESIRLLMPQGYTEVVKKNNLSIFFAQSSKTHHVIMVYTRPWDPEGHLLNEWEIIAIRDSLTRIHTQSSRPGSYTMVDTSITPLSQTINFNGSLAIEMRGLYKSVNDFLGGPFYSITIFDEKYRRIILLDAFLQAVGLNKRNMLFEMESVLKSAEF
jgi:hypothetical protein